MIDETKETNNNSAKQEPQMTLEKFRIFELVHWITMHNHLGLRHNLEEYDAKICTQEKETAHLYDLKKVIKAGAQIGVPIKLDNQEIVLYQPLTPQILRKTEMIETNDLKIFSYYQHQILGGILNAVDEYFLQFVDRIHECKKDKMPVANKPSETARALLEYAIETIREVGITKREPLIPDLYTYHSDTSLMSFNDGFISNALEGQRDGKKYTYMFSRTTSENFATVLLEVLNKKLHDQKLIASLDYSGKKADEYKLPNETKERLKWLSEHYQLTALNRTQRLSHTSGELMFLFRILQDEKIFLDNIPKEQMVLAISILTGISTNTVYNDYPFKKPYNYNKMVGSEIPNPPLVNSTKNKICDAVKGIISKTERRTF